MIENPKPGDIVMVTVYARITDQSTDKQGYWVRLPENHYVKNEGITKLSSMSPEAQQIVNELFQHSYLATWHLDAHFNTKTQIEPRFGKDKYSEAMRELLALGLIEELPNLGCRYRLVVPQVEKSGVQG